MYSFPFYIPVSSLRSVCWCSLPRRSRSSSDTCDPFPRETQPRCLRSCLSLPAQALLCSPGRGDKEVLRGLSWGPHAGCRCLCFAHPLHAAPWVPAEGGCPRVGCCETVFEGDRDTQAGPSHPSETMSPPHSESCDPLCTHQPCTGVTSALVPPKMGGRGSSTTPLIAQENV